jgi:hypothetical protein
MVEGIPVWKNAADELFFYDTAAPVKIGTLSEGFAEGWQAALQDALEAYRAAAGPRLRSAAAVKKN